jgi:phytanoyl-CoA hydroxylase
MAILGNRQWNTDQWAAGERMYEPPDWHGVSPEVIARRGRPWNQDPRDLPWLDRDGAEAAIETRLKDGAITEEEAALLFQWVTSGYFIIRNAIPQSDHGLIDEYCRDLDELWTTDRAIPGLQVMSLHIPGRAPGPIDHAEIVTWPLERRLELRDTQLWRVHYYHRHSHGAMELSKAGSILRMSELILEQDPVLLSYIGFKWGSEVGVHQDLAAMHIDPPLRLVGVWLGGEDVNPDAGPLGVFPGTHRIPSWPGWNNYPQTNLRTCHLDTRAKEEKYLKDAIKGVERIALPVNKGDAILTHGLLVHGGDKIRDRNLTRFSSVIHYTVPGGDRMHEVDGPFNW